MTEEFEELNNEQRIKCIKSRLLFSPAHYTDIFFHKRNFNTDKINNKWKCQKERKKNDRILSV